MYKKILLITYLTLSNAFALTPPYKAVDLALNSLVKHAIKKIQLAPELYEKRIELETFDVLNFAHGKYDDTEFSEYVGTVGIHYQINEPNNPNPKRAYATCESKFDLRIINIYLKIPQDRILESSQDGKEQLISNIKLNRVYCKL